MKRRSSAHGGIQTNLSIVLDYPSETLQYGKLYVKTVLSLNHNHRTIHLQGDEAAVRTIGKMLLGVVE
jgi:hypothetical protein